MTSVMTTPSTIAPDTLMISVDQGSRAGSTGQWAAMPQRASAPSVPPAPTATRIRGEGRAGPPPGRRTAARLREVRKRGEVRVLARRRRRGGRPEEQGRQIVHDRG